MRSLRFVIVFTVLAGLFVASSPAQAQEVTAHATLHQVNKSGVRGEVDLTETDGSVQATGTASGLQPGVGRYISLVYDRGSVSGGPVACEPTVAMDGMFVGTWAVDAAGNGTLIQVAQDVAPLAQIDTMSIRDTTINNGRGPEAVLACGEIAVHGGR